LALLFADQAFAAPFLTSSEQLFRLRIVPGQKQLPVPLKEKMAERPLFRRCKNSEITDAQRNIILQHHNSSVFQKSYASRYMPDTQAAYRGLRSQTALMRAAEVDRHPEVRLLHRRLKSLLQTFRDQKRSIASMKGTLLYSHYRQTYQALRNLRWRHEKALLTEIKERYKKEQPVIDIQQQLKGLPVAEQEALRAAEYVFAERVQAIDALFIFARSSMEEEF
ncbi:MAG: hypothetical protein Q9194_006371, partial [Teloschistes cf. exilis]